MLLGKYRFMLYEYSCLNSNKDVDEEEKKDGCLRDHKTGRKKIHYNVLLVKSNVMKFKFLLD